MKQVDPNGTTYYLKDPFTGDEDEKYASGTTTWKTYITLDGTLAAQYKNEVGVSQTWNYFIGDSLGSSSVVLDSSGAVAQRLAYDAWGLRTDGLLAATTRQFTGQEQIPIPGTGLLNYNARLYDPEIGRFLSADPTIPDPFASQSFNRFSYVENNPLSATDPSGLMLAKLRNQFDAISYKADLAPDPIWAQAAEWTALEPWTTADGGGPPDSGNYYNPHAIVTPGTAGITYTNEGEPSNLPFGVYGGWQQIRGPTTGYIDPNGTIVVSANILGYVWISTSDFLNAHTTSSVALNSEPSNTAAGHYVDRCSDPDRICSRNFDPKKSDGQTVLADNEMKAAAQNNLPSLQTAHLPEKYAQYLDGQFQEVTGKEQDTDTVARGSFTIDPAATAIGHTHPYEDTEGIPGPEDWKAVSEDDLPSFIVTGKGGDTIILLEKYEGQWQATVISGSMSASDRRDTQDVLDEYQSEGH